MDVPKIYDGAERIPSRAQLSLMHAGDEWAELARRRPAQASLLEFYGFGLAPVRVSKKDRRTTIDAMVRAGLLYPCPNIPEAWLVSGWGRQVFEHAPGPDDHGPALEL